MEPAPRTVTPVHSDGPAATPAGSDADLAAMVGAVASLERLVSALRRDIATSQRTIELITEAQKAVCPAA